MARYSDTQIKQGLLSGDGRMVKYVFYDHFTPLLRSNAQKAAGNKGVAFEDLVQELYLYMCRDDWERLRRYDPQMPFVNWFSVVSYRFFRDYANSVIDSERELPISEMDDHSVCVAAESRPGTLMMDIKAAIARLHPPRDREVVEALIVREEEPAEVAERLNVTVENLYNIKRRALARLIQRHLQDYVKR